MVKTFKENRELVLSLIGTDWTRSTDIFSKSERKMVSRHLKRLLADELVVVNHVSRSETYYKKCPTETELMLARVAKLARQLMADHKIFDDDCVAKMHAKIASGEMDMAQLGVEMGVFDHQKDTLNECIENLHGAYRHILHAERPTEPNPWTIDPEHSIIMRDQLGEYLAHGYEVHAFRSNDVVAVKKVD